MGIFFGVFTAFIAFAHLYLLKRNYRRWKEKKPLLIMGRSRLVEIDIRFPVTVLALYLFTSLYAAFWSGLHFWYYRLGEPVPVRWKENIEVDFLAIIGATLLVHLLERWKK